MTEEKNTENKTRMAVWFTPAVIRRMDGWLEEDNCKTRSEFIEKALRFYMGYLGSCDTTEYLSKALVTMIRGTLENHNNRLRSLLFKWCVELNMMCHTIAAHSAPIPSTARSCVLTPWMRSSARTVRSAFPTHSTPSDGWERMTIGKTNFHLALPQGREECEMAA